MPRVGGTDYWDVTYVSMLIFGAYRVAYDEAFQENFRDRDEAFAHARSIARKTRIVWVAKGRLRPKLIAVLPESQRENGTERWNNRKDGPRKKLREYVAAILLSDPPWLFPWS
jgi:hypothetical protein